MHDKQGGRQTTGDPNEPAGAPPGTQVDELGNLTRYHIFPPGFCNRGIARFKVLGIYLEAAEAMFLGKQANRYDIPPLFLKPRYRKVLGIYLEKAAAVFPGKQA